MQAASFVLTWGQDAAGKILKTTADLPSSNGSRVFMKVFTLLIELEIETGHYCVFFSLSIATFSFLFFFKSVEVVWYKRRKLSGSCTELMQH